MIPIGAVLSGLSKWMQRIRDKLHRDSRNPYINSDAKILGFSDLDNLAIAENDAVSLAKIKIAERDYDAAKHLLTSTWLSVSTTPNNELALLRLKQGFVELYQTKGEAERAQFIASMPLLLLDREMQWIAAHPEADPGAGSNQLPD